MLDPQVQGIIALVRAALTGQKQALPTDFDPENAYDAIIKHNIAVMALEGAALCGVNKQLPVMQKLFMVAFRAIGRVEQQDRAVEKLFSAFEAQGIDFLPVKGALLRGMYPKREYRSMGDMDILIRVEQYDRIPEIMRGLGYTGGDETDHELNWRTGTMLVELHKHLIPSYNRDYYDYFGSGWKLAQATETSRFALSPEDHYLYVFVHFAKHYRDGGVGIRQMCDLYLMRRAQPDMDEAGVKAVLKRLGLLEFYENILRTLECWFENAPMGETEAFITQVIYESGAFGTARDRMIALGSRLAAGEDANLLSRCRGLLRRVFLPAEEMRSRYLILRRMPVLLPVMYLYRAVSLPLKRPGELKRVRAVFASGQKDEIRAYQRALNYVGLRFSEKQE